MNAMRRLLIIGLVLIWPIVAQGAPTADWDGKPVGHWIEQLSADQVQARWYATYALGQIATSHDKADLSAAIAPLCEVLTDRERVQYEYVRGGAAWALGQIGPIEDDPAATRDAVRQLSDVLGSALISVRRNAAKALGHFGKQADPAVERLLGLFEDDDAVVRVNAALALWKIQQHPDAMPALVAMARGNDSAGAFAAVDALGHIGGESAQVLPVLIESLGHADADVCRSAARAVGRLGAAAVPALKEPLFGSEPATRRSAAEALGWIGPKAIPALLAVLEESEDATVRRAAARALGRMGPDAKRAEPALVAAVNDTDRNVREAAATALKKIRVVERP